MKISREMKIAEIITRYPQSIEVFFDYGLGCAGCSGSAFESVEEGAMKHGFSKEEIENLVIALNKKCKD